MGPRSSRRSSSRCSRFVTSAEFAEQREFQHRSSLRRGSSANLFKCQPVRVLPVSREEHGSPRTRCSTDPVRQRTLKKFDRQFDRQHQKKQFDREQQKFSQNFEKIDAEDQQNFIQKFDADPTEKFDLSNLNKIEGLSKQFARFDQVTLTRTPLKFDRAEPTRTA